MLIVRGEESFEVQQYIEKFSSMCKNSKVFQGDGCGIAVRTDGKWHLTKSLKPIWEGISSPVERGDWLIAHARAACLNDDVAIENNMPFQNNGWLFAFNGELHGVRVKIPGQTGAHKIFNYVKRLGARDPGVGLKKAAEIIIARSQYIKALNVLMTDGERIYGYNHYSEDPDYFTLYRQRGDQLAFCSQPLDDGAWEPLANGSYIEE
jgi:glutamine amidotransferase